jgi:hypothetical protein
MLWKSRQFLLHITEQEKGDLLNTSDCLIEVTIQAGLT